MILALLLVARLAGPLHQEPHRPSAETARERIEVLVPMLAGTERALATLREFELHLAREPLDALPVLLRVTEAPHGGEPEQAARLAALRREALALLAELDQLQASLAAPAPLPEPPLEAHAPPAAMSDVPRPLPDRPAPAQVAPEEDPSYSADPLRNGIACYRAGRYDEACQLLAPLDQARAHYWRARALERLERLDQAIQAMERAVALDGEGFERRRAETDLELLRWKRDYARRDSPQNVPGATRTAGPEERRPR